MESNRSSGHIFTHAGDIGDLVYGLIVMKLLGGGELVLTRQHSLTTDLHPRAGFNWDSYSFLKPLLERQAYVHNVGFVYSMPYATHDLNTFRLHWHGKLCHIYSLRKWSPPISLQQMHLAAFNLDVDESTPWLDVDGEWGPPVLFARSARYHNPNMPWQRIVDKYRNVAAFTGLDAEYDAFCSLYGAVPRQPVRDALHMANLLKRCRLFVGNQSAPYAIAEGLKVPTIQETRLDEGGNGADCVFKRANAQYVRDGNVSLPEV